MHFMIGDRVRTDKAVDGVITRKLMNPRFEYDYGVTYEGEEHLVRGTENLQKLPEKREIWKNIKNDNLVVISKVLVCGDGTIAINIWDLDESCGGVFLENYFLSNYVLIRRRNGMASISEGVCDLQGETKYVFVRSYNNQEDLVRRLIKKGYSFPYSSSAVSSFNFFSIEDFPQEDVAYFVVSPKSGLISIVDTGCRIKENLESSDYVLAEIVDDIPDYKDDEFKVKDNMLYLDGVKYSKETLLENLKGD